MKKIIILSISFMVSVFSENIAQPVIISGGTENDIIGRICRVSDYSILAIIERNTDWGSGDLYVSFSTDDGNSWSEPDPVVLKSGNQSTFSVVVTQDDSIRIYYASDETGTYKIRTISSFDGNEWVNDFQLDLGWPQNQGVYDPHVIVEQDASMTMTYVRLGGGGYVAHCSDINAWDQNKILVQAGAYRIRICELSGTYLAAYHRNMGGNQYEVNVKTSTNLVNWSDEVQLTNTGNSHDPFCSLANGEFRVYYASYKNVAYNIFSRSSPDGIDWSYESQITFDITNNTQPAFITDLYNKSEALNLVWTHAINYDTDNDIYFERYENVGLNQNHSTNNKFGVYQLSDHWFQLILPEDMKGKAELKIYNLMGQLVEKKIISNDNDIIQLNFETEKNSILIFCYDHQIANYCQKILIR